MATYFLGEDRAQVLNEFRALHDLAEREPALTLLVSHDVDQRAALIRTGLLGSHFELP